ncbi:hypothetical protein SAMN05421664_3242 [Chryseobacterium soldanellicola]|uniref:Uncharacterized protein n=1 Tax=Chryseobacterium soldanellicola TaxID=311333 RepID=A0A1H1FSA3_9FLAO|nr:hypothetical protein [Chryseobacterium soldanellicola]SDR03963.1 hypothetical protein SAMN05421664_3242 [Chryseobacterium soldanellicola]
MINMIKCSPLSKIKKQFVLLFIIFLFSCNENSNQQVEKKINDTISTNLKAEPVKNNNKSLPHRNIENGAKSRVAGKTFVAKLSQSCRATTNGAYDIYIFLNLSFDYDSVTITQQRVDT